MYFLNYRTYRMYIRTNNDRSVSVYLLFRHQLRQPWRNYFLYFLILISCFNCKYRTHIYLPINNSTVKSALRNFWSLKKLEPQVKYQNGCISAFSTLNLSLRCALLLELLCNRIIRPRKTKAVHLKEHKTTIKWYNSNFKLILSVLQRS